MARHLRGLCLLLILVPAVLALDRSRCNSQIIAELGNKTLSPNDKIFSFQNGKFMSDPASIGLTIEGCEAKCGKKFDWYSDVGPRLTTWLIPVIIIVGNLQFAVLGGKNTFFTIVHLLGDPIDSAWSLLTKLEASNRCWDLAEKLSSVGGKIPAHVRDRGTILLAIHELEGPGSDPQIKYNAMVVVSDLNQTGKDAVHHLLRKTANEISDSVQNNLPRTLMAILGYVHTVSSAFIEAVGGTSSSQPGGRIGVAMFMSWLIPVALISNSTPAFTSRRTCLRSLERFARECRDIQNNPKYKASQSLSPRSAIASPTATAGLSTPKLSFSPTIQALDSPRLSAEYHDLQYFSQERRSNNFGRRVGTSSFHDAQPWSGAIFTYQPDKKLFHVQPDGTGAPNSWFKRELGLWLLFFFATLPFFFAESASFLIIWFTPTFGLTCRHFPLFGIFLVWVISAVITHILWVTKFARGKYHWYIVLFKDAFVAIPSLALIFLTSSGLYNSCVCWSSYFSRGRQHAYVLLDPNSARRHNAETIYPGLVGACLILQALLFGLVLYLTRRGRSLLSRSEKDKNDDFWNIHRGGGDDSGMDFDLGKPALGWTGHRRSRSDASETGYIGSDVPLLLVDERPMSR